VSGISAHEYENFMLKQCLENIGEGLLHACISSFSIMPGTKNLNLQRSHLPFVGKTGGFVNMLSGLPIHIGKKKSFQR
jgi:hypothetical protein